ncbi:hypothetical protein M513_09327 [Trichuris suis]|uniref:Uncharacterized protein n=1 Tax=Trichuris suis TaxID=68888 RepID=A0A085LY14_9BILA|nr:hypothetical protein M513_09327 [Trichuris suis]
MVKQFLMNYRATPHCVTGATPSLLLHGRTLRTKLHATVTPKSIDDQAVRARVRRKQDYMSRCSDGRRKLRPLNLVHGDMIDLFSPPALTTGGIDKARRKPLSTNTPPDALSTFINTVGTASFIEGRGPAQGPPPALISWISRIKCSRHATPVPPPVVMLFYRGPIVQCQLEDASSGIPWQHGSLHGSHGNILSHSGSLRCDMHPALWHLDLHPFRSHGILLPRSRGRELAAGTSSSLPYAPLLSAGLGHAPTTNDKGASEHAF